MQQHGRRVHQRVLRIGYGSRPLQNRATAAQFKKSNRHSDRPPEIAKIAMGIVNTRRVFAVKIAAAQYDNAVKFVYANDLKRLLSKRWQISGLPLSMGETAWIEFLYSLLMPPKFRFRQGSHRTSIIRAATEPQITKAQHDQGLAVVKEAQPRPAATNSKI